MCLEFLRGSQNLQNLREKVGILPVEDFGLSELLKLFFGKIFFLKITVNGHTKYRSFFLLKVF